MQGGRACSPAAGRRPHLDPQLSDVAAEGTEHDWRPPFGMRQGCQRGLHAAEPSRRAVEHNYLEHLPC